MFKLSFRFMLLALLGAFAFTSCSDDETTPPPPEKPEVDVRIDHLSRTELTFTVSSEPGTDCAYVVLPEGETIVTAEELFQNGGYEMMLDGTTTITSLDFEGNKKYTLFVASRKINPYVYSELYSKELDTNLPYTEMLTLEKVGLTDFTYHVEVPANAGELKHVVVKESDYEAIKKMLSSFMEVTYSTYCATFGTLISESADITIDKYAETSSGDPIYVHSGTNYIAIAGVLGEDGKISEENTHVVKFTTRRAGVAPFDITANIEATSITAVANVIPDEGITCYRALIEKRSEIDYIALEGEASVRSAIIGAWGNTEREYSGPARIEASGLMPDTEYVLGIVGFDEQRNEKVKLIYFTTESPSGPLAEVEITMAEHSAPAPWMNAAVNLKVKNTNELISGFFKKSQIDELLSYGYSLTEIVRNNGTYCMPDELQSALSPEGLILEVNALAPETEYLFGVVAINEEYVTSVGSITFTTEELPQFGGEVRANMPGKYLATTLDKDGNEVTFPVTIAAGVNEATTEAYRKSNRLVCLGFGPADQFPYVAPEDCGSDLNYGPKWFIEFDEDKILVPTTGYGDKSSLDWNMCVMGDKTAYMWAIGYRPDSGRPADSSTLAFDVEVSEDGNTLTVKAGTNSSGNAVYYPAMAAATSLWWIDEELFRCYSELVLTRQPDNSARAFSGKFVMPKKYTIKVGQSKEKSTYLNMCERLSKY